MTRVRARPWSSCDGTPIADSEPENDRHPYWGLLYRGTPLYNELPECCVVDDARKIGSKMSLEKGRSFCLVLSKVRTVYFWPSGKSRESNYVPGASIGRYKAFMAMAKTKLQERSCLG